MKRFLNVKNYLLTASMAMLLAAGACEPEANTVSRNLSTAADNFEIPRRISFYNGITGEIYQVVEGYCSLGNNDSAYRMSVTCKLDNGDFTKDIIGLSDNTNFYSQQLHGVNVSTFHYRVVFRPQSLIPDVDFQGDMNELINNQNTDG